MSTYQHPHSPLTPSSGSGYPLPELHDSYAVRSNVAETKGYFLSFCTFMSILAAITLTFVIGVQLICILAVTKFSDLLAMYDFIYRLYGLTFACIGVMCEMEWTETIRTTSLLQYWTSRGCFYVFVALFTLREYGEITLSLGSVKVSTLVLFIGSALACTGVLYAVMGMFCLKKIRDEKMTRYLRMLSGMEASSSFELMSSRNNYGAAQI